VNDRTSSKTRGLRMCVGYECGEKSCPQLPLRLNACLIFSNQLVNSATSSPADDVHHDVIPQKLLDSIFNKLPAFMRQWEIQTCRVNTSLSTPMLECLYVVRYTGKITRLRRRGNWCEGWLPVIIIYRSEFVVYKEICYLTSLEDIKVRLWRQAA
jgi:hypothetical protein